MKGLDDISEVERLKIFKAIRVGCKDDSEFREYVSLLSNEDKVDEYIRRMQGYFNEDEFTIVCYLLKCCKRITPLSQTPLPNMEKGTPDYLVTFDTKYGNLACFVEVKSSANYKTSSFSHNAINRINAYGKEYGLPVLFASRITIGDCGVWILQTHDEFLENKRRATISELPNVIGNVLMNDCFVCTTSTFTMELTFDTNKSGGNGDPYYEKYGQLTGMNVKVGECTISFDEVLMLDIILSSFAKETRAVKTSFGYKVYKKGEIGTSLPLSSLLLHLNTVLSDGNKVKPFTNPSRLIAQIESNNGLTIEFTSFNKMLLAIDGSFPAFEKHKIFGFALLGDEEQFKKSVRKIQKEIKRQKSNIDKMIAF